MKTFRLIGMTLMVVLMCVACSNQDADEPSLEADAQKTYEVSLNFSGDYIDVTESPLSRADEPKKYYAIDVLCMKTDGTQSSYTAYARGVFDNLEDMKITLLGGYKYKFVCTSATEGEDKFYVVKNTSYGDRLRWPYESNTYLSDLNKFTMKYNFGTSLYSGYTYYNNGNPSYYPKMDRYYGEPMDYTPKDGGTATIPMKRCVFGVKMTVNAVPDGTLSWDPYCTEKSNHYSFNLSQYSHIGTEKLEFSSVYTFYEVYNCWQKAVAGEDYTKTFTINFTWTRANGYTQNFSKEFTVKRNVMTNINVTLTGGSEEVSVGIQEENSEMTSESTDVNYDGGSLNGTEVDPQQ